MSRTFRRALALAAATPLLAAGLVAGAPAAGATGVAPHCGEFTPVDFTLLGGLPTYVSTRAVSGTRTHVCFMVGGAVAFHIAVDTTVGVEPPTVTQTEGAGACGIEVVDMAAPVPLVVSTSADATARSVCVGLNGEWTTLTIGAPGVTGLPSVDVWTTGGSLLDYYFYCGAYYAESLLIGDGSAWVTCRQTPHEVI